MRHIILLYAALFSICLTAQNWVEPGAEWHMSYGDHFCAVCQDGHEIWMESGDTIFDGVQWQRIRAERYYNESTLISAPPEVWETEYGLQAPVEQEIYYRIEGNEVLVSLGSSTAVIMVHLDAEVGDSWPLDEVHTVVIDSIADNGDYGTRRHWYGHYESVLNGETYQTPPNQLLIVEGIHMDFNLHPWTGTILPFSDDPSPRYFLCYSSELTTLIQTSTTCTPLISNVMEISDNLGIRLWPNPVLDDLRVSWPEDLSLEQLILYDCSGRIMHQLDLSQSNGSYLTIPVSSFESGMYLIRFMNPSLRSQTIPWVKL